jgi:hypothetical protein
MDSAPVFTGLRLPVLLALLAHAPVGGAEPVVYGNPSDQWTEWQPAGRDDTVPGEVAAPYPTIRHLAVEWRIEGDDNLNATVGVRYRPASAGGAWREALPLRRVPAMTFKDARPERSWFSWANRFSGSLLDLEPGTAYEIELTLGDPDGGGARRTLVARTRPLPAPMPGAPVRPATPETFAAVYAAAQPGDILLLAPGLYGEFTATKDGEPDKPIVIRADPMDYRERDWKPGDPRGHRHFVVFRGLSLAGRKHVHVEGVLSTAPILLFNAEDCAVMRCRVHAMWGILAGWSEKWPKWMPEYESLFAQPPNREAFVQREFPRKEVPPHAVNCYIADNVVIGVNLWDRDSIHAQGKNLGEGIEISGPGNVVCHNFVSGFRDCISLMEGPKAENQQCIDIYNNDIQVGCDDGIEADYAAANVRILRNRLTNCMRGIAVAPALGGPVYVLRNVLHNTEHTWQLGRVGAGYVVLHNTSVKSGHGIALEPHLHALVQNNLFLVGGPGAELTRSRAPVHASWDYDHNGYGVVGGHFRGTMDGRQYSDLVELRAMPLERHAVRIDAQDFVSPPPVPADLFPALAPADLRLAEHSTAIDAGRRFPNVNDAFTGAAPDLGAHEAGEPVPVYGPRPLP